MSETPIASRIPDCPQCHYAWDMLPPAGSCPECGIRFDQNSHRWPVIRRPPAILHRLVNIFFFILCVGVTLSIFQSNSFAPYVVYVLLLIIVVVVIRHFRQIAELRQLGRHIRIGWIIVLPQLLLIKKDLVPGKPHVLRIDSIEKIKIQKTQPEKMQRPHRVTIITGGMNYQIQLNLANATDAHALADALQKEIERL